MLLWPVEGDREFGIVDIVVAGVDIAGFAMKGRAVDVDFVVGGMNMSLVVLTVNRDSHIDLEVEEVAVVEEDI